MRRPKGIVVDNPARGVRLTEVDGAEITERPLRPRLLDGGAVHPARAILRLNRAVGAERGRGQAEPQSTRLGLDVQRIAATRPVGYSLDSSNLQMVRPW